ncbi:hypothetical protein Pint_09641 [Pistacia integerrima]|uniref:Uncharacterized protein n=1 Tax=Pistacia integerrima TaxID=434235 RepID=A0ACC0XLD7_9ROSI|nr:hypothetical protein Pint_09641 [Pistacia integerrima]
MFKFKYTWLSESSTLSIQFKRYLVRVSTLTDSETEIDHSLNSSIIQDKDLLLKSHQHSGTGLHVLDLVNRGSMEPDRSLYNTLLKRCTHLKKLKEGRIVHAHIAVSVFKDDIVMHNTIINMYAKCGSLDDARKLFDVMPVKNMVTWTALITGYSQNDQPQNALVLFPQMLRIGLKPNQFTLSSVLKASGTRPSDEFGKQVHAFCLKFGYDWNVYVGSSLLDMYARFGRMRDAWLIFNELESKNEVSWNALIAGHARKGEGRDYSRDIFENVKKRL